MTEKADTAADRIAAYLGFAEQHPEYFPERVDGVQIVLDPARIRAIEEEMGDRYVARSWPREWAEVGLGYVDPYLFVLRDAVIFPDGSWGIHHRALPHREEPSGAVVLPIYEDRILLLRHFRHPTGVWSWEIPRGAVEPGESAEDAVRAELREEIEAEASEIIPLGPMHGASGFMGHGVRLFLARLGRYGAPALDEGIAETRLVTPNEFEALVLAGEIADSFTLGAFLHARLRGLV